MLEVGRQAFATGEWESARAAFESVLAGDPRSAEAHEGRGWSMYWLDSGDESLDAREIAYRIYLDRGDKRSAARVATGIAVDATEFRGMAVANGWLQRARSLLADVELSPEHGYLALWEGHFARMEEHDLDKAIDRTAAAQDIARKLGIEDLELLASALEGLIKVTEGNVRDGMSQLDEATAAAVSGEIADLDAVAATCCMLVHACERVRDYDRAAQWGERIEALARRWRVGSVFALCEAEHAAMLIGSGQWAEAEKELKESLATLEAKRPMLAGTAIVQLADLRRRQGRIEEALDLYRRVEANTLAILGLAAIALDAGDADRCAELVDRLRRRPMAEKWVERAMAMELLVRARSDLDAMNELRDIAAKVGTEMIRAIASSAEAAIAVDDATKRRHLEDALDHFERCGAPWEAARTRLRLADVLRALGRESSARAELAAGRAALQRLGVVESRRESQLTPRETEVLQLVARGMSDKEVAGTLRLSEHTVHRHVANILAKLNAPSRAAAVAMAFSGHPPA